MGSRGGIEVRGGLPFLVVEGSHREVGRQIGEATAGVLRHAASFDAVAFDEVLPPGRSRDEQLALASRYRDATLAATPWLVDEIDGAAEGAGVDPLALFAASIEEIWSVRPSQATGGTIVDGRCSDMVAAPPATPDGHVWVAHTNDLSPVSEASVVAIEWRVPGEPVVFSLGIGPWISVGWNSAGLSLTGNELAPNDERVGVPRLLMVREQLTARTLDEAVAMALRPDRASSYNTVFAHRDGRVVNVEGSATDAEITTTSAAGTLAHTNHYACERMRRYEGDPDVRPALRGAAGEGAGAPRWAGGRGAGSRVDRPRAAGIVPRGSRHQPVDLPPRRRRGEQRDRVLVSRGRHRGRDPVWTRAALSRRGGPLPASPESAPLRGPRRAMPAAARCASRFSSRRAPGTVAAR